MAHTPAVGPQISVACDECAESAGRELSSSTTDAAPKSVTAIRLSDDGSEISGRISSAPQVFNRQAFVDRMMGDQEFAHRIAGTFIQRLPRMIEEAERSLESGSVKIFRGVLHGIKGSAANVGGEALSDLARQIEENETPVEVRGLISELAGQAELLIRAIRSWTL